MRLLSLGKRSWRANDRPLKKVGKFTNFIASYQPFAAADIVKQLRLAGGQVDGSMKGLLFPASIYSFKQVFFVSVVLCHVL